MVKPGQLAQTSTTKWPILVSQLSCRPLTRMFNGFRRPSSRFQGPCRPARGWPPTVGKSGSRRLRDYHLSMMDRAYDFVDWNPFTRILSRNGARQRPRRTVAAIGNNLACPNNHDAPRLPTLMGGVIVAAAIRGCLLGNPSDRADEGRCRRQESKMPGGFSLPGLRRQRILP